MPRYLAHVCIDTDGDLTDTELEAIKRDLGGRLSEDYQHTLVAVVSLIEEV
jgi:Ca2+-binding EF-hand superfamily protein